MRLSGRFLAATAILVAGTGSALAADVVIIPPPAPAPPPPVVVDNPFDGPYWGFFAGRGTGPVGAAATRLPLAGTQFGYNFLSGNFMAGFEIETEHLYAPQYTVVDATLNGRFGFVLGNTILIYGQGGIGTYTNIPAWSVGGGVEFALNAHVTLFGEVKLVNFLGSGLPFDAWRWAAGVNYYADPSNLGPGGDFDWGGLYFGAHGGATTAPVVPHVGVQVGYNFGGPVIFGAEVETSHTFGGANQINALLNGRIGFAPGNVLLYGEGGIGVFNGTPIWTAGGGAELALGTQLGLFAEGKAAFGLGGGGFLGAIISGGLNIHFGH